MNSEDPQHRADETQLTPEGRAVVESLDDDSTRSGQLAVSTATAMVELAAYVASPKLISCGPYRLVRLLGRGGMGAVYLGERADGEVAQRVAVKLLRYLAEDASFRERFLQERQILATLKHPAIARLLDAGHTADGQPYLVMDYIDGVPIDVYAKKLALTAKLQLFRKVCDAVSYAHRNLIVHRDVKPSNILVDAEGRPVLLDFGIAKILDAAQNQASQQTATSVQALTPQYASPEQVRGDPITTVSDVYSLGVLLYELLTGRLPYEFATFSAATIHTVVCEVEPAPPRISDDLDNILLMALRKEPARRYLSVQELADDIDRALSHRPIRARRDTIAYRAAKFIRRNRFSFSAGVLALMVMIAGTAVAMYQARVAQRRFQEVRKLAHTFVFDLHDQVASLQGSTKVRQIMVRTGLEYLDSLVKDGGADLDLQREIAAAYVKIGDTQGHPNHPNLGRIADALTSYRKAGDIYRKIAEKDPKYLPDLADYYYKYSSLVRFTNNPKQTREFSEAAIRTFDRVRGNAHLNPQFEYSYVRAWCSLGDIDEDQGRYAKAWSEFSRCRELAGMQLRTRTDSNATLAAIAADERIGTAAQELGFLSRSLQAFEEEESFLTPLLRADPNDPRFLRFQLLLYQFRSRVYYDDAYPDMADPGHALECAKAYLASAEAMARRDPDDTTSKVSRAVAMCRVSFSLREFDPAEAIRIGLESLRIFDELEASGKTTQLVLTDHAQALERLAAAQYSASRFADARHTAEKAVAAGRAIAVGNQANSEDSLIVPQSLILVGRASAAIGDVAAAERSLTEAYEDSKRMADPRELTSLIPLAQAEEALGDFYSKQHRTEEARRCYGYLAKLWQSFPNANEYVDRQKTVSSRRLASIN